MKERKNKKRIDAVAVQDGETWRVVGEAPDGAEGYPRPAGFDGCRSVRFLVSGPVHRMDGAIPSGMSLDKANEVIRASIGETTGAETDGLIVAGFTPPWLGTRKPFTLAFSMDEASAEELNASLAESGASCGGFASLELALFAVWREKVAPRGHSLAIVGQSSTFVVPSQRAGNPGPASAPCGTRHFAMDRDNWLARFRRAASDAVKDDVLHVIEPAGKSGIAAYLRESGFATEVVEEDAGRWIEAAAKAALRAKANRTRGVALPVANPWQPRRLFHGAWIAAAAVFILALPAFFGFLSDRAAEAKRTEIMRQCGAYRPLEKKIADAKKSLATAEAELASEMAAQSRRTDARRPLVSFIDVAGWFCKNAGRSLVLDGISQKGDTITVRGSFTDPEDGVGMNKGLSTYARAKNIEIAGFETSNAEEGDAAFSSRFTVTLDCAAVGRGSAVPPHEGARRK